MTLVLLKKTSVSNLITGGLSTIAVRMPKKQIARDIIKLAGVPLAAPSANMFQRLSPTNASHVAEQLGSRIDGIVDGGACEVGVESTVVGFENGIPVVYRPGAVTGEMIAECLGMGYEIQGITLNSQLSTLNSSLPSPGLLNKHYCPSTPLFLGLPSEVSENCGLLAFGELPRNLRVFAKVLNLSEKACATEAAANLYGMLHELDSCKLSRIFAMLLPPVGLGNAVNDRLRRAALSLPN